MQLCLRRIVLLLKKFMWNAGWLKIRGFVQSLLKSDQPDQGGWCNGFWELCCYQNTAGSMQWFPLLYFSFTLVWVLKSTMRNADSKWAALFRMRTYVKWIQKWRWHKWNCGRKEKGVAWRRRWTSASADGLLSVNSTRLRGRVCPTHQS